MTDQAVPVRLPAAPRPAAADGITLEKLVAVAAVLSLGFRYEVYPELRLGFLVALVALPVTLGAARRFSGALLLAVVTVLAVLNGFALTWLVGGPGDRLLSTLTLGEGLRVLMIGAGALLLLWARTVIGTRATVFVYGVGALASVALVGVNPLNPWKFSFSVPLVLLALSLPLVYKRRPVEVGTLLALGALSAFQDSRSAAAQMLIAAAVLMSRRSRSTGTHRGSTFLALARLGVLAVGGFLLIQAALLSGDLGEEAQQRTEAQVATSGSVLVGGRPELGASAALLSAKPWGYGFGAQPTPTDISVAKQGMSALNYDPDNGYVENYMFGNGFEVHSQLGDLWILAGPAGAVLALLVLALVVWGMAHQLARGAASGILLFLTIRAAWDTFFAPAYSALPLLMLCLALALPLRGRPRPRSSPRT